MKFSPEMSRARVAVAGIAALGALGLTVLAAPASASTSRVTGSYSCTATALGSTTDYSGTIDVSGVTPSSVAPAATVKMTGFQTAVVLPASVVNEILQYTNSISGKITTFDVTATDAAKATVNAAAKAISIPKTKLTANTALTITLPKTPITVSSWKASSAGTMTFSTGKVAITIKVVVSGLSVNVAVACSPNPAVAISTTKVS